MTLIFGVYSFYKLSLLFILSECLEEVWSSPWFCRLTLVQDAWLPRLVSNLDSEAPVWWSLTNHNPVCPEMRVYPPRGVCVCFCHAPGSLSGSYRNTRVSLNLSPKPNWGETHSMNFKKHFPHLFLLSFLWLRETVVPDWVFCCGENIPWSHC